MVRLSIFRHAKSSWAATGMSDIDREIAPHGAVQLACLREWVAGLSEKPDACICSPAVRTRQTWSEIQPALNFTEPEIRERLYPGSAEKYLEEIWASEARHLLVIGHNPTCDELTRALCRPSGSAYDRLSGGYFGTANWATLRFDGDDLRAVALAQGVLEHYVGPRDLCDI